MKQTSTGWEIKTVRLLSLTVVELHLPPGTCTSIKNNIILQHQGNNEWLNRNKHRISENAAENNIAH